MKKHIMCLLITIMFTSYSYANSYVGPEGIEVIEMIVFSENGTNFFVGAGYNYNKVDNEIINKGTIVYSLGDIINKKGEKWYYCKLDKYAKYGEIDKKGWINENDLIIKED